MIKKLNLTGNLILKVPEVEVIYKLTLNQLTFLYIYLIHCIGHWGNKPASTKPRYVMLWLYLFRCRVRNLLHLVNSHHHHHRHHQVPAMLYLKARLCSVLWTLNCLLNRYAVTCKPFDASCLYLVFLHIWFNVTFVFFCGLNYFSTW